MHTLHAEIEQHFRSFCLKVLHYLEESGVQVKEFLLYISSFSFEIPESELGSVDKIFTNLIQQLQLLDFRFNWRPVSLIIEKFHLDKKYKELKSMEEEFLKKLSGYLATIAICDYIEKKRISKQSPRRYHTTAFCDELQVKLETKVSKYTLSFVKKLWNKFEYTLGLPKIGVILEGIYEGCIAVVWLIFPHVPVTFLEKVKLAAATNFYTENNISKVILNGEFIYLAHETIEDLSEVKSKLDVPTSTDGGTKDKDPVKSKVWRQYYMTSDHVFMLYLCTY